MSWPKKQKAPAGALKHKLVLDGYHFCEVEQHLFVLHGIVWYGVTLELCGTELHLNDLTLMGHDIILQRPSRTFYNDKKAKAPARALTHQLVLIVFMANSCCRQKIYQS